VSYESSINLGYPTGYDNMNSALYGAGWNRINSNSSMNMAYGMYNMPQYNVSTPGKQPQQTMQAYQYAQSQYQYQYQYQQYQYQQYQYQQQQLQQQGASQLSQTSGSSLNNNNNNNNNNSNNNNSSNIESVQQPTEKLPDDK
jgi:hypothetical protein